MTPWKRKSFKRVQWDSSSHLFLVRITVLKAESCCFENYVRVARSQTIKLSPLHEQRICCLLLDGYLCLGFPTSAYEHSFIAGSAVWQRTGDRRYSRFGADYNENLGNLAVWVVLELLSIDAEAVSRDNEDWRRHEHSSTQRALLGKGWFHVEAGGTRGFVQWSQLEVGLLT